jgi:hypothetical protein
MSYDLYLFHRHVGRADLEVVNELLEAYELQESPNPGSPDPAKEAQKQELSSKLIAANPELSVFKMDYPAIADDLGMSVGEAKRQHRHIEINGLMDGNGIQILLFDDTASITIPYRKDATTAQADWDEIWRYLAILESEGSFATYDGQIEKILDLEQDMPTVIAAYNEVIGDMPSIIASVASAANKKKQPWWKVW